MKKNIFIINGQNEKCGVYQYGLNTSICLRRSNKFNYSIYKYSNYENFIKDIQTSDGIIYNYHPHTLPWLNSSITSQISIPQFCIGGHDSNPNFDNIKYIFLADPSIGYTDKSGPVPRPLINFNAITNKKSEIPIFGSFGFGFSSKLFKQVAEFISASYQEAIINIHIPIHPEGDSHGHQAKFLEEECKKTARKNITINIDHDFFSPIELIQWLNKNDMNIFIYPYEDNRGISSVIDYALSAKKPIAINNSPMFRHISSEDKISCEKNSLQTILNYGLEPTNQFRSKWSEEKNIEAYDSIIEKFI